MSIFSIATVLAWTFAVLTAWLVRGRPFVFFVAVMLGLYSLIATSLAPYAGAMLPLYAYLHATVYVNFVLLARPRMRPFFFRVLVSWPAAWFLASTLVAFPLAIGLAFAPSSMALRYALLAPYAIGLFGFIDSFVPRKGAVPVVVGEAAPSVLVRRAPGKGGDARPLRVVQITDPHLGPFMSVDRLRGICERAVAENPDLVLLTGDFLTMESHSDRTLLGRALSPLKALDGRVFACLGNHDYEAMEHVRSGLESAGATLLVDEMRRVETAAGPVEILGFDFRRRQREAHLAEVTARHARPPNSADVVRIGLLHDPGAFRHMPDGAADIVLSGHTHGGQLGLLWMGLPHTIVSAITKVPDHGLWARGKDRLYVHRGTGHYGFPLRLGVPPEETVLEIHRSPA